MSTSEGNNETAHNEGMTTAPAPAKAPSSKPQRIMTPADFLRSSTCEPDATIPVVMRPRDDRRENVTGYGVALYRGMDNESLKSFRYILHGHKGKAADEYEAYLSCSRRKFVGFEPGTFDISQFGGNDYDSEAAWLVRHPVGLEMLQFITPLYLSDVSPDVELIGEGAASSAIEPAPRHVMTPADLLRSRNVEPDRVLRFALSPRSDRAAEIKAPGIAEFEGSDPVAIKRFRELLSGYKSKPGDRYEAYLHVARQKFRGFEPGTFDTAPFDGNRYGSDLEWFTRHPVGLEMMQYIVPNYLGEVAPELETKNG